MTAGLASPELTVGTTMITGTVSGPGGYPLAGIEVRLYDTDHDRLAGNDMSDDSGRYRFPSVLTDGTESFQIEAEDLTGSHVSVRSPLLTADAGVNANQDMAMEVAGIVQGRVTTGRDVLVTADGSHTSGEVAVSPNGTFRIGGLPTGTYTLTCQDLAEPDLAATATVNVTAGRTTTLEPLTLSRRPRRGWTSSRS